MKNFFLMITLLAFMAACGGGKKAENTDTTNDSSATNNTENAEGTTTDDTKSTEAQYGKLLTKEEVGKAKEYTSIAEVEGETDKSAIIRYRPKDYAKEFPTQLMDANNLQVLVLQNYGATTLPDDIKKFKNLTLLYLDGANKLEKLPEAIGELKNLKTVSLGGCKSLDINQVLGVLKNCPNLENLSLSYIPFTEMPATIGELKNLKYLRIKNNKFKTLPDEFYKLENLDYLAMGSTPKDQYNYEEIFTKLKDLPKLKTLFFPFSGVKTLPDVMKDYPSLKKVAWKESDWKDVKAETKKWSDKFPNFEVTWSTSSTPMYYFY
ncbi:hypothetical protein BKI52_28300 [marine bacterium AO1-C]|nr:hypothetical protein BKI52_28300 [marine bacterium AO1-C]